LSVLTIELFLKLKVLFLQVSNILQQGQQMTVKTAYSTGILLRNYVILLLYYSILSIYLQLNGR